jgi:protein tyrosine phosphatase (PTP) superfamily phosphohydrolase (DUF442 family)
MGCVQHRWQPMNAAVSHPSALPALALLLLVPLGGCINLHAVEEGRVYRSMQPDEDQLARWIERYGLRTVLCLRGPGAGSRASGRPSVAADIAFVQVPMSATRLPRPETLLALWRAFEQAEYPLLLHCRAGADRSGLASALYVLYRTGDLDQARSQLRLIPYGHLGMFGTEAMGEVLDRYEPFHGRLSFPDWVREHYRLESAR